MFVVFFELRVWSRTTYRSMGNRWLGVVRESVHGLDAASVVEILQSDFFVVTIVFLKKTIVVNLPMMGCYKPVLFIVVWILLLSTGSTRKCCDSKCTSKYCLLN